MCEIFERIALSNKTEGIQEGIHRSNVNAIRNVMKNFNLNIIQAMQ